MKIMQKKRITNNFGFAQKERIGEKWRRLSVED
jgi:hypothetical protein